MLNPERSSPSTTTTRVDPQPPVTEEDWFRRYNERPGDTVMSRTDGAE